MRKIGIIICNYNKREYVLRCIESLEKQSFREFEVHVVDNASTD
ncbi:MAG: glycosyltransferase, partial [Selenomonadaceae bacterium]|nr:glycosyltransferase [Selenomonadaceae bacterium]